MAEPSVKWPYTTKGYSVDALRSFVGVLATRSGRTTTDEDVALAVHWAEVLVGIIEKGGGSVTQSEVAHGWTEITTRLMHRIPVGRILELLPFAESAGRWALLRHGVGNSGDDARDLADTDNAWESLRDVAFWAVKGVEFVAVFTPVNDARKTLEDALHAAQKREAEEQEGHGAPEPLDY